MAFSLSGKPWGDLRKFDVVNWSFEEQDVALSIIGRSAWTSTRTSGGKITAGGRKNPDISADYCAQINNIEFRSIL